MGPAPVERIGVKKTDQPDGARLPSSRDFKHADALGNNGHPTIKGTKSSARNPKSDFPKPERRPKSEGRATLKPRGENSAPRTVSGEGCFGLRPSDFFRPSDFELRISAFLGLLPRVLAILLTALFLPGTPALASDPTPADRATVILAVGAPGEDEFGKQFGAWTQTWNKACAAAQARAVTIGLGTTNAEPDLDQLKQILAAEPKEGPHDLWLVLIGHGTFDGREARFNLRGPDLAASELAGWLQPFRRPVIVINCASSSSPFLNKLSAVGRIIVTSTRSGHEENFARFGGHLAPALTDPAADLDKDGQVSLLEAYIMASRRVGEWYDTEGRLATEHALLDDNGDGVGTPADWYRGVRAVKKPEAGASVDGLRAHQVHLVRSEQEQRMPAELRARRDELERSLAKLRDTKATLGEEEYYRRLENLMLELARLYSSGESTSEPADKP